MTDVPELQRMSLMEALRHLATGVELAELDRYSGCRHWFSRPVTHIVFAPAHEKELVGRYVELRKPLEARVWQKLCSGEWHGWGVELPLSIDSCLRPIASGCWKYLQLDFEKSTASGNGLKLVDIQVSPSVGISNAETASEISHSLVISSKVEGYILLSDDNEILEIHSVALGLSITVILKGKVQQSIMRQLVDAFHRRKRLKTSVVLERANSAADSIAKAFNGNSNWSDLKRVIKQEKGYIWLEI